MMVLSAKRRGNLTIQSNPRGFVIIKRLRTPGLKLIWNAYSLWGALVTIRILLPISKPKPTGR